MKTRGLLSWDNGKGTQEPLRNTTCKHGVMTGPDVDGEECADCATVEEELTCLNNGPDCKGKVEYRLALSGTGRSFPRCDGHWGQRLDLEQGLRERYPEHQPSDFDPTYAGESWEED